MVPPIVIEGAKKLEEAGIIKNYSANVSLKKMNRTITIMVLFRSKVCHALYNFYKKTQMS